jgi:hypothetical protein
MWTPQLPRCRCSQTLKCALKTTSSRCAALCLRCSCRSFALLYSCRSWVGWLAVLLIRDNSFPSIRTVTSSANRSCSSRQPTACSAYCSFCYAVRVVLAEMPYDLLALIGMLQTDTLQQYHSSSTCLPLPSKTVHLLSDSILYYHRRVVIWHSFNIC